MKNLLSTRRADRVPQIHPIAWESRTDRSSHLYNRGHKCTSQLVIQVANIWYVSLRNHEDMAGMKLPQIHESERVFVL